MSEQTNAPEGATHSLDYQGQSKWYQRTEDGVNVWSGSGWIESIFTSVDDLATMNPLSKVAEVANDNAPQAEDDLTWLARHVHRWHSDLSRLCYVSHANDEPTAIFPLNLDPARGYSRDQWLARRADLQNKPRWLDAPEWAEWLAQDADGEWYWYKSKPVETEGCHWYADNQFCAKGVVLGDWRDTLEQRPDMHKSPEKIDTSAERIQKLAESIHDWYPTDLPPIGVDCELVIGPVPARCCVVAYSAEQVVVRWAENGLMDLIELPLPLSHQFRPIRTERDIAIDEITKFLVSTKAVLPQSMAICLYDAGYRKQDDAKAKAAQAGEGSHADA